MYVRDTLRWIGYIHGVMGEAGEHRKEVGGNKLLGDEKPTCGCNAALLWAPTGNTWTTWPARPYLLSLDLFET